VGVVDSQVHNWIKSFSVFSKLAPPPFSGVFRGGHGAMPPLWPDHENFLQATLYEKVHFLPFSSKFQKKWANLRLPLNVQKQNVFQLQGASPP